MRRRIFLSMAVVAVITVVLGGLTSAVLIERRLQASTRTEFVRQAAATAQLVRSQVGVTDSAVGDVTRTLRIARVIGGHDYVEAAVVTRTGVVRALADDSPLVTELEGRVTAASTTQTFDIDLEGKKVAIYLHPIEAGERRLVVVLGTSLDLFDWGDIVSRMIAGLLVATAVAAALAWWLARTNTERLGRLHDGARALAAGDLEARVDDGGGDEIGAVASAFNDMASRLASARARERAFLGDVSHDLRTPLTTIRGYGEALAEGGLAPEEIQRIGGVLDRQAERLSRLVEDLMLLSRLESDDFSVRAERVDVSSLISGLAGDWSERMRQAHLRLEADVASGVNAEVDADRVAQVVENLLENAVRYTPEGGTVRLTLRDPGADIVVQVADDGPGIDPLDAPYVFDRMVVARKYRTLRPVGSGLGLSIVRRLVERMGGRVTLDAVAPHGSLFTVTLPRS